MKKKYLYCVYGRGPFPDDMLRYDSASVVVGSFHHHLLGPEMVKLIPENDKWTYYILTSERPPTIARWNSFLWGVTVLS